MEANRLISASGFFISAITTLSLAVLAVEYIRSDLISFFPFSFILVLYLFGLYLRSREFRRIGRYGQFFLTKISFLTTSSLGITAAMIFLYFGAVQTVTYPLDHYSFNVFFIAIAAVWAVYSLIELYVIDKVSAENRNMSYFTVACIITAVSSVFLLGYFDLLLPIALVLLSISTFLSGMRIYRLKEIPQKENYIKRFN